MQLNQEFVFQIESEMKKFKEAESYAATKAQKVWFVFQNPIYFVDPIH
jgi:hypothetical protein